MVFNELGRKSRKKLIFKQFDLDNDGLICFNDLKQVMLTLGESMSENDIGEMISEANTSDSGGVTFDEFVAILRFWINSRV